ncbi:sigma factor-like helix-turn-helix DNA-binding protein [Robertmurraya andreesenii]|uniref:DNA-directed RNA polymerase specialized sigma subunit n=1 Tax=Anoxybacillus andreesenii TaxID=1325932 RepID=A0ABT9V1V2_9BACL|nr:sigma factor-like helix-turn-helix DNA-binding protein [Robertmurraya andreesenii]MDQ0154933.1 DNA-directed RNA polymerase specialized sigma subunit [Robertmurraya andreesenii]
MGAVKTDLNAKERTLEAKYHALDSADGVRQLLGDYNALVQRQYAGDYNAIVILVDLATAIERAGLTDRQRQALALVFEEEYTQVETADELGISKQTVNRLISVATAKVARVYEAWARMGEGYSLGVIETEGERYID